MEGAFNLTRRTKGRGERNTGGVGLANEIPAGSSIKCQAIAKRTVFDNRFNSSYCLTYIWLEDSRRIGRQRFFSSAAIRPQRRQINLGGKTSLLIRIKLLASARRHNRQGGRDALTFFKRPNFDVGYSLILAPLKKRWAGASNSPATEANNLFL